jgi:hypothetical protein
MRTLTVNGKQYRHVITCRDEKQVKEEVKELKIKAYIVGYAIYEEIKGK